VKHLDSAAVDAVKKWRFVPTVKDGRLVEVAVLITTNFTFRTDPQPGVDLDIAAFYVTRDQFELAGRVLTGVLAALRRERAICTGATRVGAGVITEPAKIKDVRPVYPRIAQQLRRAAVVVLDAMIDTAGAVTCLQVLRGDPFFDQSAIDAVRQWRYTPTLVDGAPVPVVMTVTVTYSIR
jgi:TonB family protein